MKGITKWATVIVEDGKHIREVFVSDIAGDYYKVFWRTAILGRKKEMWINEYYVKAEVPARATGKAQA